MTLTRLIFRDLVHFWRLHAAVALGLAVASAVLTGALLAGGSVAKNLEEAERRRMGTAKIVAASGHFFRRELARELEVHGAARRAVPAVSLPCAVKAPAGAAAVPDAQLLAVPPSFFALYPTLPPALPGQRGALINRALARDLSVAAGEWVILHLPAAGSAPRYSLFGGRDREHAVKPLRLRVAGILEGDGAGAFSMEGGVGLPRTVYVDLDFFEEAIGPPGRVNLLLADTPLNERDFKGRLASRVTLADAGLSVKLLPSFRSVVIQCDRLTLPAGAIRAAHALFPGQTASTSVYLFNRLGKLPYAAVAAADSAVLHFSIPPGEIVLNAWAARELNAKPGESIAASFSTASESGALTTREKIFRVREIVPVEGPFADPGLVPDLPGLTDAPTLAQWRAPFPVEWKAIRPADEEYWRRHGPLPKAFVCGPDLRTWWRPDAAVDDSLEGWVTGLRISAPVNEPLDDFARRVETALAERLSSRDAGMTVTAVGGGVDLPAGPSTDFRLLFFVMSLFIVISGLLLSGLLLHFLFLSRERQFGLLRATGVGSRILLKLLLAEGMALALSGALVGLPLGLLYSAGLLHLLTLPGTAPFGGLALKLYAPLSSLGMGAGLGFAAGAMVAAMSVFRLRTHAPLSLLTGSAVGALGFAVPPSSRALWIMAAIAAGLLGLSLGTEYLPVEASFFLGGGLVLAVGMHLTRAWLWKKSKEKLGPLGRSLTRFPARNLLTLGLFAFACFILLSSAGFRTDRSTFDVKNPSGGAGGFTLLARSRIPLYHDLSTAQGRSAAGLTRLTPEEAEALAGTLIFSFRASDGEDVSCLNPRKPATPRFLGVPRGFAERGGFAFAGNSRRRRPPANPWEKLWADEPRGPAPLFGDRNSLRWILKRRAGETFTVGDAGEFRVAGELAESIFAGELLISEENFRRRFGGGRGFRFFLLSPPAGSEETVRRALLSNLSDLGLKAHYTADVLAEYARVQNTYLLTFQLLGGLGFFLGTLGLFALLLRNAIERRAEFAFRLSVGFTRWGLIRLLVAETLLLVAWGAGLGTAAGLMALVPRILAAGSILEWGLYSRFLAGAGFLGLFSSLFAAWAALRGNLLHALRTE